MLKKEFTYKIEWFKDLTVKLDLGFQGFADLYSCKKLVIPVKKKRAKKASQTISQNKNLTADAVEYNKGVGSERIYVEHAIGEIKCCLILEHRNRLKSTKIINIVIGVYATLWNFYLITL